MTTSGIENPPGDVFAQLLRNPPNVDLLTLINTSTANKRIPRHKPGGRFIKGPLPFPWVVTAGQLRGKALMTSLVLWRTAGWKGTRTFTVPLTRFQEANVNRQAARRGLRALEAAGLISLEHAPGRAVRVTLLDGPAGTESL